MWLGAITKPLPHLVILMLLLAKLRGRLLRHRVRREPFHPSIGRLHVASDVGCNVRWCTWEPMLPCG